MHSCYILSTESVSHHLTQMEDIFFKSTNLAFSYSRHLTEMSVSRLSVFVMRRRQTARDVEQLRMRISTQIGMFHPGSETMPSRLQSVALKPRCGAVGVHGWAVSRSSSSLQPYTTTSSPCRETRTFPKALDSSSDLHLLKKYIQEL